MSPLQIVCAFCYCFAPIKNFFSDWPHRNIVGKIALNRMHRNGETQEMESTAQVLEKSRIKFHFQNSKFVAVTYKPTLLTTPIFIRSIVLSN